MPFYRPAFRKTAFRQTKKWHRPPSGISYEKINIAIDHLDYLVMDSRTFAYPIIEMEPTVPSWWLPRNLVVCGGVSLHLLLRRATSINLKVVIYAVVCAPLYKPASASSISVVS